MNTDEEKHRKKRMVRTVGQERSSVFHLSPCLFLISVHLCASVVPISFSVVFLCPQAREDCQRCLFCALAAFSYWPNARGAAVFARACGDQFARLREQQAVCSVERFGETDSAGVSVIQIQVRLEEFLFGKRFYRF